MAVGDLSNVRPLEITVDGRIDGQQIVNKFWYFSTVAGTPGINTASNVLFNFRAAFRSWILPFQYDYYTVFKYVLREIADVLKVGTPPAPTRYKPVYSTNGFGILAGTVTDTGQLPAGVIHRLPAHECLRAFKQPSGKAFKFFKSNYNRFAAYTVVEKDALAEKWTAGARTNWQTLTGFNVTSISGNAHGGVAQLYQHCVFSGGYWYNVIKPFDLWLACSGIDAFIPDAYVGTQTTRRYTPAGSISGK